MDLLILSHLKDNSPMSGYDVIKYLHRKFHILPSSGKVYSLLYSLERQRLVRGTENNRKRVYKLTQQGEEFLREIQRTRNSIKAVLSSVLSEVKFTYQTTTDD